MRKKKYIIYNILAIIILLVIIGILIIRLENKNDNEISIGMEKVTDDCIYETEELEELTASSAEQKLSPNAELVIQKHYTGCGHTVNEYTQVLPEMVNKNQEEIENEYKDFNIQSFASQQLIIEKEETGYCGEHYILRDDEGMITVYAVDENNKEKLYERTSIPTQYLTQTDLINLKNGVRIYGREKLNSMLEDYE